MGTGGGTFTESVVKSVAGIWLIGAMEMVIGFTKKASQPLLAGYSSHWRSF